ncbi:MAG: NAD(P) transhydrogenase subunit alpha [Acidobacteria bacterium RBG_16_70_10]|nr:MAG: NAD(P) transhydrogenase subunit alpha [Acidobacteria bacterium RBG_16_70_10]
MKAGVLKESWPGEARVAVVPGVIPVLSKAGVDVLVESGAGVAAGHPDAQYAERGASVVARDAVLSGCELVLSVRSFAGANDKDAIARLGPQHVVVGFLEPLMRPEGVRALAARGATSFALDLLPRITRAQSMDALSSTATVVGYKAVLLGAEALPRMLPMLMTAAGTVAPARVFVIGAGVAGLQAIATAKRLGAVVEAYDMRPAVKDQIQSLGAKFVELPLETSDAEDKGGYAKAQDESFYRRQRELLANLVAESDIVITAAAVPGKKAPVLVTTEMVAGMRPGSVIVDLAAEQGGNCEATKAGETVIINGVKIMGPLSLAATVPYHASQLYAKNVANFVTNLLKKGQLQLDLSDEIVRESMLTRSGEVVHARVREALGLAPRTASG